MLVSIIVPEYNAVKYIHRNLKSILSQSYKNIEVILYDDASKDNTREIMFEYAKKYPDKIYVYWSDKNGGIGHAKNSALSHVKGDYVFFCDCDDMLKPDTILNLVKCAENNSYPDIVVDGFERRDSEGKIMYLRKYKTNEEALNQSIPLFAKLYKKEFLDLNEILSPEGRDVIIEDTLYQCAIIPNKPRVAFLNYCGYIWIKNLTSVTHTMLNSFRENTIEESFKYLIMVKNKLGSQEKIDLMTYYVVQFVCWYLLKTGAYVNWKSMKKEYKKAFLFMDRHFPQYKKINYVSLKRPKGTRMVVRFTVLTIMILKKLHLESIFFWMYSNFNFSKFWPNL